MSAKQTSLREYVMKVAHKLMALVAVVSLAISGIAFAASPVNINTANAAELAESLDGIGPSKAQAIVEYRETHGNFSDASEITQVKGIGNATFERNKDVITIN